MQRPIDYPQHVVDLLHIVGELIETIEFIVDFIDHKKLDPAKIEKIVAKLAKGQKTLADLSVRLSRI